MFELTDAGEQVLAEWLDEPVTRTRELRMEFLLKLYIGRLLDAGLAERLVVKQRTVCESLIESLREQVTTERDDFRRLVLQMRLAQNEALLSWLSSTRSGVAA